MSWKRTDSRRIRANQETVFNLLAEIELWPTIFPHIRSARVVKREGNQKVVVVKAKWRGLPLSYTAVETVDRERGQVTIRHLSRLTKGSVATWTVMPSSDSLGQTDRVELRVREQVDVPMPLIGDSLANVFVGGSVARELSEAMLDRIKEVAEGGSLADRN
jgi:ribosome-associated toxin RatA of RatAB toxin-antitoxin module